MSPRVVSMPLREAGSSREKLLLMTAGLDAEVTIDMPWAGEEDC